MELLEDKGGRPDRNEPDSRVRRDSICLIYGFSPQNPLTRQLNGKECYVTGPSTYGPERLPYPPGEVWFECQVRGMPVIMDIPIEHLMLLDDSDRLVIEELSKSR